MANGTVKWFNPGKGFGFIKPDDGSNDVFVHVSALANAETLDDGAKVTFEMVRNNGKPAAADVKQLDKKAA